MKILLVFAAFLAVISNIGSAVESAELTRFAEEVKQSYEKRNSDWLLGRIDSNGVPNDVRSAQEAMIRAVWGNKKLHATSVEVLEFEKYKSSSAPGTFNSRKLRFISKPSHWVVLTAENEQAGEGAPKMNIKLEFPVVEKQGLWTIVGVTYQE